MSFVPVSRSDVRLEPDPRRVIVKPFLPGGRIPDDGRSRVEHILDRVLAMSPDDVARTLAEVREGFSGRHQDLSRILRDGFATVAHLLADPSSVGDDLREVVGAYFVHEYAVEAAALTNPSLVAAPDQTGAPPGWLRVIVSLRAIGEGHLSSIEFRSGMVGPEGQIEIEPALPAMTGRGRTAIYDREMYAVTLDEAGASDAMVARVLDRLDERFTMAELESAIDHVDTGGASPQAAQHAVQTMHWLADSNYELEFPGDSALSQRVVFPAGPGESHGMEDARFVRFEEPDGTVVHCATYTAYDGITVLPQMIETSDFVNFRIATLNGAAAHNKGITIFPRRVGGKYVALGRADNENNYLMVSDNIRRWSQAERIQVPVRPWELIQIGNCGSPIETSHGWLVVTHGVGPMRTYSLGAILLDLEDPSQVIGHLRDPLLVPDADERDGYVPNVVYSCGSLVHNGHLVLAYGASDDSARFAIVPLDALLDELVASRSAPALA